MTNKQHISNVKFQEDLDNLLGHLFLAVCLCTMLVLNLQSAGVI